MEMLRKLKRVLPVIGLVAYLYLFMALTDKSIPREMYQSENGFITGAARPSYGKAHFEDGLKYTQKYQEHLSLSQALPPAEKSIAAAQTITQLVRDELGAEYYQFPFQCVTDEEVYEAQVVFGVLRAPKSDGTESMLLSTSYSDDLALPEENDSVGFFLSLLKVMKVSRWLARDHIFVFTPSPCAKSAYTFLVSQLHSDPTWFPEFGRSEALASLSFDWKPMAMTGTITIDTDGSFGQLPNLDLVRLSRYYLRPFFPYSQSVNYGALRRDYINFPEFLQPYIQPWAVAALRFTASQMHGIPVGPHSDLPRYNIDGLTFSLEKWKEGDLSPVPGENVILSFENLLRSLNNLNEHLHQSFYYYLVVDSFLYIPIGDYMIGFGLVIGGTALYHIANLFTTPFSSFTFPYVTTTIALPYLVSLLMFVLPLLQEAVPVLESLDLRVVFVGVTFLTLAIARASLPPLSPTTRSGLNSLATLPLLVFLSVISLLNFSFAILVTAFVVPFLFFMSFSPTSSFGRLVKYLSLSLFHPLAILSLAESAPIVSGFLSTLLEFVPASLLADTSLLLAPYTDYITTHLIPTFSQYLLFDEPLPFSLPLTPPASPTSSFLLRLSRSYMTHTTLHSPFFHIAVALVTAHLCVLLGPWEVEAKVDSVKNS